MIENGHRSSVVDKPPSNMHITQEIEPVPPPPPTRYPRRPCAYSHFRRNYGISCAINYAHWSFASPFSNAHFSRGICYAVKWSRPWIFATLAMIVLWSCYLWSTPVIWLVYVELIKVNISWFRVVCSIYYTLTNRLISFLCNQQEEFV